MLIQLVKFLYQHQDACGIKVFGEESEKNNPFAFNNVSLWTKANAFLQNYIEIEVKKIVEGKRILLFTNREDILFTRLNVDTEEVFKQLIDYLEKECMEKVTAIDKAFLECKLYNDVEECIIYQAVASIFMKHTKMPAISYRLFVKKMRMLLEVGSNILFTDLEELYAAYHYKSVWQYHYESE